MAGDKWWMRLQSWLFKLSAIPCEGEGGSPGVGERRLPILTVISRRSYQLSIMSVLLLHVKMGN